MHQQRAPLRRGSLRFGPTPRSGGCRRRGAGELIDAREGPSSEDVPVEDVAREQPPGPAWQATPIAPERSHEVRPAVAGGYEAKRHSQRHLAALWPVLNGVVIERLDIQKILDDDLIPAMHAMVARTRSETAGNPQDRHDLCAHPLAT